MLGMRMYAYNPSPLMEHEVRFSLKIRISSIGIHNSLWYVRCCFKNCILLYLLRKGLEWYCWRNASIYLTWFYYKNILLVIYQSKYFGSVYNQSVWISFIMAMWGLTFIEESMFGMLNKIPCLKAWRCYDVVQWIRHILLNCIAYSVTSKYLSHSWLILLLPT